MRRRTAGVDGRTVQDALYRATERRMCCRASSTPVRRRRITASNAPCTHQPAPPQLAPTQSGSALRRARRTSLRVHTARGVPAGGKARRCSARPGAALRLPRCQCGVGACGRVARALEPVSEAMCARTCRAARLRPQRARARLAAAGRAARRARRTARRNIVAEHRTYMRPVGTASRPAPCGAGQSGAHASRACAMAPSHPSRGRQLRRLVGLLLAVLCIWALLSPGQARGAFEDAGCATVLGDDASLLGAVGQGKAAAAGLRRRGAGAPAASVAGASNGSGRSGSVRSLCAAAASLAAKPAPRPLAAVTTAVGRVCAALEAPPGAVRLGAAAPRLPVRSSHSRRVAPRPRLTRRPARHRRTTTSCRESAPGARKPWAHTCATRSRSRC